MKVRAGLLAMAMACAAAWGQDAAGKVPKFDVTVVKENKSGEAGMRSMYERDGMTAVNIPVTLLLRQAYSLYASNDEVITGLPAWAATRRFDVQARVAPEEVERLKTVTSAERAKMVRGLLEDRFNLRARAVKVEQPVYALVVAKAGPKMTLWKGGDVMPNGLPASDPRSGGNFDWSDGSLKASGVQMDDLLMILTQEAGRTVVDETGLKGRYDFTLHWTPAEESDVDSGKAAAPGLFTALQEQLGLKLEAKRGMVDGLVVERLDLPGAN